MVAAASNAARMIRAGGGFNAESDEPVMIAQVQLDDVPDTEAACAAVLAHKDELLRAADAAVPNLVRRGGGARGLEARDLGDGMIVVHFLIDCRDAMGANLVNTVAEAVADRIAELTGGQVGLRILSNLCDQRCVRVRCSIPRRGARPTAARTAPRCATASCALRASPRPTRTAPPRTTRAS